MSPTSKPGWEGAPHKRGRHGVDKEQVRASQRSRLVQAMLSCVAELGYPDTTVPLVVARARVSRNAFYEFFEDKEACFVDACAEAGAELFQLMKNFANESDWMEGLIKGFDIHFRWWQERPGFSRAVLLELPLVSRRAVEQRDTSLLPFEEMFARIGARIRRENPKLAPLPPFVPRLLMVILTEFLAGELRAGRGAELSRAVPQALWLTVKLLADDAAAVEALRRCAPQTKTARKPRGVS